MPRQLVAVLSGWNATLAVGTFSVAVAVALDPPALVAWLAIIARRSSSAPPVHQFANGKRDGSRPRRQRPSETSNAAWLSVTGTSVAVRDVPSVRHLDPGRDFVDTVALADGHLVS